MQRTLIPEKSALLFASQGWHVLPVVERTKRPAIAGWPARATTDPEQIVTWWRQWPNANVGICCGHVSGILVLDVDGDLNKLLAGQHLPPTITQTTGGGGWQFLYHWTPELDGLTTTLAALMPSVDTRGDGGFIVAPPSLHPSGKRYEWAPILGPGDIELAPPPEWLVNELRTRGDRSQKNSTNWRCVASTMCPRGRRNLTLAKLVGHLLRRDIDAIVAKALQKESCDRYGTAHEFAEDIRRSLRCEPIVAR